MTYLYIYSGAASAVVLLACLAILYRCRWRDYLLPSRYAAAEDGDEADAPVSIVVTTQGGADAMRRNLPLLLEQEYLRFEVIVVDRHPAGEVRDVVRALQQTYRNLRYTFIPPTARYVDHEKLAVTLGVKAAHYDWVVLTRADAAPASPQWLATLARCFDSGRDVVLGHAGYAVPEEGGARATIYYGLCRSLRAWRAAADGEAVDCTMACVAIRREAFIRNGGFGADCIMPGGEGMLLMKALSSAGNTGICAAPDAFMWPSTPTAAEVRAQRMERYALLRRTTAHYRHYARREALTSWATYSTVCIVLATIAYTLYSVLAASSYDIRLLYLDVPVLVMSLTISILSVVLFRKATTALMAPCYGVRLFCYALGQPWQGLYARISAARHKRHFHRPLTPDDEGERRRESE